VCAVGVSKKKIAKCFLVAVKNTHAAQVNVVLAALEKNAQSKEK